MKIITVISDKSNHGYANYLEPSCSYHGLELIPLFASEHLKPKKAFRLRKLLGLNAGEALLLKDKYLSTYLETLPDEEVVLFTDGYDTMLLTDENELLEKFKAFDHPLIFSAEVNCHPCDDDEARYPTSPTSSRFLNSGGWIGRVGAVREALKHLQHIESPRRYAWSNQYRWTQLLLTKPNIIKLDYNHEIFFCAATRKEDRGRSTWTAETWQKELLDGNRIRIPENGTSPCHLHFNGPISTIMKDLEEVFTPIKPWLGGEEKTTVRNDSQQMTFVR